MMREELEKKVSRAKLLIRRAYRQAVHRGCRLEICISGGKDSDVLIELCKMSYLWGKDGLRPLHKCTTIDPAGTLRHVLEQGVEVLRPRMVRFYIRNGAEYWRTHPDSSLCEYFADVYEQFVCDVFCKDIEDFRKRFCGIDCKSFLEGEFGISLDF